MWAAPVALVIAVSIPPLTLLVWGLLNSSNFDDSGTGPLWAMVGFWWLLVSLSFLPAMIAVVRGRLGATKHLLLTLPSIAIISHLVAVVVLTLNSGVGFLAAYPLGGLAAWIWERRGTQQCPSGRC